MIRICSDKRTRQIQNAKTCVDCSVLVELSVKCKDVDVVNIRHAQALFAITNSHGGLNSTYLPVHDELSKATAEHR